jgi:hypothetical protein
MDQTAVITRPAAIGGGRYNAGPGGDPVEKTYRCRLEQSVANELVDDRATQISEWILFLPHDADIRASDLVAIDDLNYEVIGPPEAARTRGHVNHLEARLRFVKG